MNKGLIKYLWALPLLGMLSGCSESAVDEGSQNSKYAVRLDVSTSKLSSADGTKSRATIVDNTNVINKPFGLYAYSHAGKWTPGQAPSTDPNFMNDQKVSHETGSWAYDPLKFWTNDKISFFGYWPYDAGTTSASALANAMPQVEFTQKMEAENMVDFIASHAIDQISDYGTVTLDFKHVLTRLNFKARLDEALAANTTTHIFIKSVKVCGKDGSTDRDGNAAANADSKFYNKATFVLGDGSGAGEEANGHWVYDASTSPIVINAAEAQPTALDLATILKTSSQTMTSTADPSKTYTATAVQVNDNGTPTDLFKQTADNTPLQHYLFLIPPHGTQGIQSEKDVVVELEYDIVTLDEKLSDKFVITPKKYAVSLPNGTLKQGIAYNVIFTVGLNPVKVDVNVSDWGQDETSYAPSTDAASNSTTDILAAWKKMNTTKAQNLTDNYFVINVANKPSGALDLRSKVDAATDFNAFEMGDQVELRFADDKDGTGYTDNVLVPNGWVYENRTVNGEKRHIITKTSKYITEVATATTAGAMKTALSNLNTKKADTANKDIHNYAVDIYSPAADADDLSLTSVDPDTDLNNFTENDNIFIIFNSENAGGAQTYTAPAGWTIEVTKTPGKYQLKKITTKGGTTGNLTVGEKVFADGGAINVNK